MPLRVVEPYDCVFVEGALDRAEGALEAAAGRLEEGFFAGPEVEEHVASVGLGTGAPPPPLRFGEDPLGERVHVGVPMLRLHVDAHRMRSAEGRDNHVGRVGDVEVEDRVALRRLLQMGFAVGTVGEGKGSGIAPVSAGEGESDQCPTGEVAVPVRLELVAACPGVLGRNSKRAKRLQGIAVELL